MQDSVVGIHVWDSKLTIAFLETDSARWEAHLVVLSYELNLRTQRVRLFPRAEYSNANWKILHPTATPIGMHHALCAMRYRSSSASINNRANSLVASLC